jgi:hypothetical protein
MQMNGQLVIWMGSLMGIARIIALTLPLAFLLALSLAGGAARAENAGVAITDPAILRSFLTGNTLYGANSRNGAVDFKWSEYHCANGRSIYVRGLEIYRGKWWLEGSEVCYAYNELDPGAHFCFRLFPQGDGTYDLESRADPSADVSRVTILGQVAGDPFKIQNLVGGTCEELSS